MSRFRGHVLAVSAGAGVATPGYEGLSESDIVRRLTEAATWIGPRSVLEEDERFLQIIPYIVIRVGNQILMYRRSNPAEVRLNSRASAGFGGHIDLVDLRHDHHGELDLAQTLMAAADREIAEELSSATVIRRSPWQGFVYEDSSAVGRLHLGVVGLWDIEKLVASSDNSIAEMRLIDPRDVLCAADNTELWTILALQMLTEYFN